MLFQDLKESSHFIMCIIPKNGCTNWKRLALRMRGQEHRSDFAAAHNNDHLDWLYQLSPEGLLSVLSNPTIPRVLLARNPYARLLSAYLDMTIVDEDHPQF